MSDAGSGSRGLCSHSPSANLVCINITLLTCLFVVTLELLAWHSQGCVSHVYSVWEDEDSGCFSTRDPNSSNWGHFCPSILNQYKDSAITPTLPSLRPHPGLEMGIATTPKAPEAQSSVFMASWIQSWMCTNGVGWAQPCQDNSQKSQDFQKCS